MRFAAIRVGQTVWDEQGRIDPLSGVQMSELGEAEVRSQLACICNTGLDIVFAGSGVAEQLAAEISLAALEAKLKTDDRLDGLDFGLWQGLTRDEVKHRQPRLWKQWREAPLSVRPPGGETLEEVHARMAEFMAQLPKKHKKTTPLLVLKPIVFAVLECMLTGEDIGKVWGKCAAPARVLHARFAEDTHEWLVTAFEAHGEIQDGAEADLPAGE